jgi:hypothetical protein
MTDRIITPRLGSQPIETTSATQINRLGEVVEVMNVSTNTVGQFIYVQASNSITQYDAVAIKGSYKIAPLTITNGITAAEVGFAQIAVGDKDSYCWVQKSGRPICRFLDGVEPGAPVYASAQGGRLAAASSSVMVAGIVAITDVTNSSLVSTCVARYPQLITDAPA